MHYQSEIEAMADEGVKQSVELKSSLNKSRQLRL